MIGVVAKIKVKDGAGADFEAVAKELVAAVNANEPDCTLYALHKAEEPNLYVFMERYKDEAAVKHHRGTDHFRNLGRKMGEFMDGAPDVMRMPEV
ncbi:MAG: antibiotic biosynthesis monooxygenase [Gammaproteobacteria bacterium]|nr:antibiotic biosynthesis monooxygenase [Gammaproteobacteria bacterium]